jgi:Kef-type K+ transport system membrane component KefB
MNFKKLITSFFTLFTVFNSLVLGVGSSMSRAPKLKKIPINFLSEQGVNAEFAAKFALFVALLLLATVLVGKILKVLFKLPTVAGQIIGGIFLGPSFLDIKNIHFFSEPLEIVDVTTKRIYSFASSDLFLFFVLLISSALTVSYLLWLAGHETDVKEMTKVGIESTLAGLLGAVVPILMITATAFYIFSYEYNLATSIGLGVVFAATSVSIPIAMLIAQNKMGLRSSKATMGAAIVDDILAVILFSIFAVLLQSSLLGKSACNLNLEKQCSGISSSLLYMLITFVAMFFIGKFFIVPTAKKLKTMRYFHLIPSFAALTMLSYFSLAELLGGLAGITGAYFAGLFHRMGDDKHKAVRAISPFVNTLMLPLFLGSVGMQVDLNILRMEDWTIVTVLLFVAIISKLIGCHITTIFSNWLKTDKTQKWTFIESYIFGSSMVARGEVGLVIATILNGTNLLTPHQYIICVTVIILTTIASPIMISIGFNRLAKKEVEKEYSIQIGPFHYISSRYLFDIITYTLELEKTAKPIVTLSEGKKILTVGNDVKIILDSQEGINFKGNESKINTILNILKTTLYYDIEKIPGIIQE